MYISKELLFQILLGVALLIRIIFYVIILYKLHGLKGGKASQPVNIAEKAKSLIKTFLSPNQSILGALKSILNIAEETASEDKDKDNNEVNNG